MRHPNHSNSTPHPVGIAMLASLALLLAAGCSSQKKAQECEDQPKRVVESTELGKVGVTAFKDKRDPDTDRCVACVMSPAKYATCQTVYAKSKDEKRDSIRARAREKACDDAGFKKGECPDSAVISLVCKGEPRPDNATDPGRAIQKLFQGKKVKQLLTTTSKNKTPAPAEGDNSPKPPSTTTKSPE